MATMVSNGSSNNPFLQHPIALLSVYELGPSSVPIPRYDGPQDWHNESILFLLHAIAWRMYNAEDMMKTMKEDWNQGGHTEKCRSMDMELDSRPSNGRCLSYTTAAGSTITSSSQSGSRGARNDTNTIDLSSIDCEMLSSDGSEHEDSSSDCRSFEKIP